MATSSFRLALKRAFSRENRRAVIRKGRLETLPFPARRVTVVSSAEITAAGRLCGSVSMA